MGRATKTKDIFGGRVDPQSKQDGGLQPVVLPGVHESREAALERHCRDLRSRLAEQARVLAETSQELSAEIARREEIQAALSHAQKLEALGYLTSGVAHDFNNILQAVQSGYEVLASGNENPRHRKVIDYGRRVVEQGSALTRRLLTYVRREARKVDPVAPPALLAGIEPLIRQVVKGGIKCEFVADQEVWPILVDRRELETVLLNLAVNARDAMPNGGRLLIAAGNAPRRDAVEAALAVGDYVVLAVRDTGAGMPPAVLARATEAFFTTKGGDLGTGLGLAMAKTFAERAGGALCISSAPGEGTTIQIYLPRAAGDAQLPQSEAAPPHRGGVILLAEENEATRAHTAGTLRGLGYHVIEAGNAKVALALSYNVSGLDLAIASATLPECGGGGLAERLRIERPKLPMIFLAEGGAAAGADILARPVGPAELAAAVSARLAERRSFAEREETLSARLHARLAAQDLKERLELWRRLRGCEPLPRIDHAEALIAGQLACHFFAAADAGVEPPRFRLLSIGQELIDRLGRPLQGMVFDGVGSDVLGSLAAAYGQAARSRLPVYDWLRHRLGDGPPIRFDRLILPMSEDGHAVSHLVGIVLFSECPQLDQQESPS